MIPLPPPKPREQHANGLSYGVVYVNALAREALLAGRGDAFPVGSVIVREKHLTGGDDKEPQLLAVMVKREPRFNPRAAGWEFLTVDGARTRVLQRQKTGDCLACHASQRERDFVFPFPK